MEGLHQIRNSPDLRLIGCDLWRCAYGYNDDHSIIPSLQPLNPYGVSKNEFDKWVLRQKETPPYWYGLKFFNVYGPNEYHKGRMASVIFHSFKQVTEKGVVKLFRSHKRNIRMVANYATLFM